ncbi:MAG: hypothetical protein BMS9Abin01_0538 [Gammaproteobacteria bacterium]|nr:MAG: hypothetical protein BMS9Abin01_0538 [Gammaproteobacteria bacterium]
MTGYPSFDWDVDRVYETIRTIVETMPDRLPGTDAAAMMAEFSREGLERAGVPATVHPVHALVSVPEPANLSVIAPIERNIPALTMAHSPSTREPIEATLTYVGLGGWGDYDGIDVTGIATLSELSYAPPRQEKQRIAGIKGSCAQIMMNWGYPDSTELPMGSVKSGWGNPTRAEIGLSEASLPCAGISRQDGEFLRRLCAEGLAKIRLETRAESGWRDIHVTTGGIDGGESDDFILVGGHQDGWFGGAATDNASGSAMMLELARAFVERMDSLRRGLTFGFWAGHETGTMAGSAWWADRNWDRLRDHAVGYLQIDQPACVGTSGWTVTSNYELHRLAEMVHVDSGDQTPLAWGPQVKSGDSSFFGIGVPIMVGHSRFPAEELRQTSNAAYGWWHHTARNEIDKIDKDLILPHLRIYAQYLTHFTMDPILPLRMGKLGSAIESRLLALCRRDLDDTLGLHHLHDRSVALSRALANLDAHADRLSGQISPSEEQTAPTNNALKRLSRVLVPVASTVAGKYAHDPYGLTEQLTMLPSLYGVAEYLSLNGRAEREMHWVELIRARNQISDALRDALGLCELAVDVPS